MQPPQTTLTYYNAMLQATNAVQPDGASVYSEFHPTGQLKKTYGARTYPVEYTYDHAGRLVTLKTWQDAASPNTAAMTRWNYDVETGWLLSKDYPDPDTGQPPANPGTTGPLYAWRDSGQPDYRTWARGANTQYYYTLGGDLEAVAYPYSSTPTVTNIYDRLGRPAAVSQTLYGDTRTLSRKFGDSGEVLSESWQGGPLNSITVSNRYDHLLRRTNVAVFRGSTQLAGTAYAYDAASRLQRVTTGTASAAYSYIANSPLVDQIAFTNNGARRMLTTKQHDFLNRLSSIASAPSAGAALSFAYTYNAANQRVERREANGAYWQFGYDTLGQVTSGKKFWADATPVAGQQFEYEFDDIGNRVSTKAGGDANGSNLRSASYSANFLNQYDDRTVPGAVDVIGVALATNTATVNGQSVYRKGEYFRKELPVDNSSGPVWTNITVAAPGETTVTGHELVPPAEEQLTYDADGNLIYDGLWGYTWDGENRLLSVESLWSVPEDGRMRVDFSYDAQGRRIEKVVSVWDAFWWQYVPQSTNRFVYDGWNVIAVLDHTNGLVYSFSWGLDLSGSLQGAGGVGGLLSMTIHSGANAGTYFYAYDGNGNVAGLVNASDGAIAAIYEYGPFGELLRATGPMAKANPIRFSTQYIDDETDLVCYLHRYYNPSTGRWVSRDPVDEAGFRLETGGEEERIQREPNLYGFVRNDPANRIDLLGLLTFEGCSPDEQAKIQNQWNSFCQQVKSKAFGCCLGHFNIPQRLGAMCDRADTKIVCKPSNTKYCGWTYPFGRTIYLGQLGLSEDPGCGPIGCTLLHEMTHMAGQWPEKWPNRVENCLQGCPKRR